MRTGASGLFPNILSILFNSSSVNLGTTSIALRFSKICSGLLAPNITVEVFGYLATHAKASAEIVVLSSKRYHSVRFDSKIRKRINLSLQ